MKGERDGDRGKKGDGERQNGERERIQRDLSYTMYYVHASDIYMYNVYQNQRMLW